jgi:GntR family transcriptional repressor for pyruvate dehydrogenase complex
MDTFIKEARGKILNCGDNTEVLMQQHEEIYLSIKNKNPKAASLAMSKHLQFVYDTLMKEKTPIERL